jgi:hypothetical protein
MKAARNVDCRLVVVDRSLPTGRYGRAIRFSPLLPARIASVAS